MENPTISPVVRYEVWSALKPPNTMLHKNRKNQNYKKDSWSAYVVLPVEVMWCKELIEGNDLKLNDRCHFQ